jgi:hypothetical protein
MSNSLFDKKDDESTNDITISTEPQNYYGIFDLDYTYTYGYTRLESDMVQLKNNTLKRLNLSYLNFSDINNIDKNLFEALRINTSLILLKFYQNNITVSDLDKLCDAIKDCNQIRDIDFSDNDLNDDHVKSICKIVRNTRYLDKLLLNNNRITDIGVQYLCASFPSKNTSYISYV